MTSWCCDVPHVKGRCFLTCALSLCCLPVSWQAFTEGDLSLLFTVRVGYAATALSGHCRKHAHNKRSPWQLDALKTKHGTKHREDHLKSEIRQCISWLLLLMEVLNKTLNKADAQWIRPLSSFCWFEKLFDLTYVKSSACWGHWNLIRYKNMSTDGGSEYCWNLVGHISKATAMVGIHQWWNSGRLQRHQNQT